MSDKNSITQTPFERVEDKRLNILFLGGAKRVSFGRMLIDAGSRMGLDVKIFSYELTSEVPIASIGGIILGRKWNSPDILEHLHQVVKAYRINLILPFVDGAVSIAASYLANFDDGVKSPVINAGKAEILFDKISSAKAFENAGLRIPPTYTGGHPAFPLIAKPRRGSASKGIRVIETVNDFKQLSRQADQYLIQAYYPNREEFTVDCYISQKGEPLCVSPRKRLEVVGGEVSRTQTVDDPEIVEASLMTIDRLDLRGAVTIQFLRNLDDGSLLLMEINPRLGGGVVCSVHAGADIPGLIIKEVLELPLEKQLPKAGVLICRYFEEVVFDN